MEQAWNVRNDLKEKTDARADMAARPREARRCRRFGDFTKADQPRTRLGRSMEVRPDEMLTYSV